MQVHFMVTLCVTPCIATDICTCKVLIALCYCSYVYHAVSQVQETYHSPNMYKVTGCMPLLVAMLPIATYIWVTLKQQLTNYGFIFLFTTAIIFQFLLYKCSSYISYMHVCNCIVLALLVILTKFCMLATEFATCILCPYVFI